MFQCCRNRWGWGAIAPIAPYPPTPDFGRNKAELLQEGIFFLLHLFARELLEMKMLEIEKTKTFFIISVLKVEY